MQRRLNRRVLLRSDASQALRTELARKPAAVVLDIGLPDYDGTEFVSGRSDRREIASLLGATYLCGKPFEVDELVGEVKRAVLN